MAIKPPLKEPPTSAKRDALVERAVPVSAKAGHRRWWQRALRTTAFAVCAIAAVELFFNISGVGMEEILQPDVHFGTVHIPNQHFVWRMEGFADDRFNALGQRDVDHPLVKPAGTYRIALIGDSSTESLQVPFASYYGAKLQQVFKMPGLKTEVINFACSGYSTGQEVLEFEQQAAAYKPDLTILLYNRGDAVENVRKPGDFSCEPRPYFYLDSTGSLKEDDQVLSFYGNALKPNPLFNFLRRDSRIFGVLDHTNLTLSIHEPLYRKLRGWVLAPFSLGQPKLKKARPLYAQQDAWAVTAALVARLSNDCHAAGSRLVVVDFPNVVNDPELDRQIKELKALATKDNFGNLDLTPAFRWNPDPMSLFLQYHFSSKGHKVVANQIGTYLNTYLHN